LPKAQFRADHEVLYGSRHQDLPRSGQRSDPSSDHDAEASHLVGYPLAFSGVDADADPEPELFDLVDERRRASDRPSRSVERDEEPVAGRIDLPTPRSRELPPDDRVEALEQVSPSPVAEFCRTFGGGDDIDEHHRQNRPMRFRALAHPREELLDLLDCFLVSDPRPMVGPWQLDELRPWNMVRDVLPFLEGNGLVVAFV
jgi:hypothetical protein